MLPLFIFLSCVNTNEEISTRSSVEIPRTEEMQSVHPKVIFLGDSLSAGMGLAKEQAFPQILSDTLQKNGLETQIINAGISGDTTTGGLRRLDWLLKQEPQLLVLELGANDGMRGQPLEEIEKNLVAIIKKTQEKNIVILLLGMRIPTNLGDTYTQGFADIYPRVAKEYNLSFVPFLLQDVAGEPELNQEDGIHPTAKGQEILAKNVYEQLKEWRAAQK